MRKTVIGDFIGSEGGANTSTQTKRIENKRHSSGDFIYDENKSAMLTCKSGSIARKKIKKRKRTRFPAKILLSAIFMTKRFYWLFHTYKRPVFPAKLCSALMSGSVSRRRRKERKKEQFSEITERIRFSAILQAHKRANNSN